MNIILYTTHCPRCKVLEEKLKQKNINYTECTDTTKMIDLGMTTIPMLQVDESFFNFSHAVKWINSQEIKNGNN